MLLAKITRGSFNGEVLHGIVALGHDRLEEQRRRTQHRTQIFIAHAFGMKVFTGQAGKFERKRRSRRLVLTQVANGRWSERRRQDAESFFPSNFGPRWLDQSGRRQLVSGCPLLHVLTQQRHLGSACRLIDAGDDYQSSVGQERSRSSWSIVI